MASGSRTLPILARLDDCQSEQENMGCAITALIGPSLSPKRLCGHEKRTTHRSNKQVDACAPPTSGATPFAMGPVAREPRSYVWVIILRDWLFRDSVPMDEQQVLSNRENCLVNRRDDLYAGAHCNCGGHLLVELHADHAVVEVRLTRSGIRHEFRRCILPC
jgi:hypothetical protein